MKNVTINNIIMGVDVKKSITLNNGSLVLHCNRSDKVIGAYIVTSFRDSNGKYKGDMTTHYCSLVNLDNGYLAFEERCSRATTIERVLWHLNHNDYRAKEAIREGQYLEIYPVGEFKIDLIVNRGRN